MKKGVVIDLCDEDDDLLIVGGNDGYEEDDDALFNFSGVTNLSREAGYSPASRTPVAAAASPPSSPPRSSRVSNFDQDDHDEDLSLLRRSVPEGSLARAPSASAPAPSKQVSAVAPVNESSKQKKKKAGAEPPAKKKKGRTDLERLADLEARCHQDVLREEFIGGMEAGNFLRDNVVLNESESASGCLVFVCKSTGVESQHVLRLMSGLELLKMLREEVRAAGKRDWVDAIETMDAFVETLKDAHQGRQLSVIVFEMDQGFKVSLQVCLFLFSNFLFKRTLFAKAFSLICLRQKLRLSELQLACKLDFAATFLVTKPSERLELRRQKLEKQLRLIWTMRLTIVQIMVNMVPCLQSKHREVSDENIDVLLELFN